MDTNKERVNRLIEYVKGIHNNLDGKELYLQYQEDLKAVKPQEAFEVFYCLLQENLQPEEILVFLDKIINVFYKSLSTYSWKKPQNDDFLVDLIQENQGLIGKLGDIKKLLKIEGLESRKKSLIPRIEELQEFNDHYLKKENVLFPYLEKKMDKFQGLTIMWALHDEVRKQIKKVIEILKDEKADEAQINTEIGKLFFGMHGLVKKEELILFPAASEILTSQDWEEMYQQSLDYNFPFIEKKKPVIKEDKGDPEGLVQRFNIGYHFKTETGALSFQQLMMIFNTLPVDLTFVDENNKVQFFTSPKDRIFPRSPAVIGRDVKNCHPPHSVHVVHKIIDSFRSGKEDRATFWIRLKGRVILIQYFALRDSQDSYRGVLEVSQDITEIQKLKGEKRLLEW